MDKFTVNNCQTAPGLAIHGGSSPLAKTTNTTFFKANGRSMYFAAGDAPSLALATLLSPTLNVGTMGGTPSIISNQLCFGGVAGTVVSSLAFDNGTVPVTTNSCQMFTLCADCAQTEAGTVTLYWLAGTPFPKHRQMQESDIAHTPLSTSAEIGYLYVKNETAALFVPGTTNLDTSSITTVYRDNYAQYGK